MRYIMVLTISALVLLSACTPSKSSKFTAEISPIEKPVQFSLVDLRPAEQKKFRKEYWNSLVTYYYGDSNFSPEPIEIIRHKLSEKLGKKISNETITINALKISVFDSSGASRPYTPTLGELENAVVGAVYSGYSTKQVECVIEGTFGGQELYSRRLETKVDSSDVQEEVINLFYQTLDELADQIDVQLSAKG